MIFADIRSHPKLQCAQAAAAGHMAIISRWEGPKAKKPFAEGMVHSCLSCYVATKSGCGFAGNRFRLLPREYGEQSPAQETDQLGEGDESPSPPSNQNVSSNKEANDPSNAEAGEEPDIFSSIFVPPVEIPFTPTPSTKKRNPETSSPFASSGERPTKRVKDTDYHRAALQQPSLLSPKGLPNNPNRPLRIAPEAWLARRQAAQNDPKGKARHISERPNDPPNLPSNQSPTPNQLTSVPQPRELIYTQPGRFSALEQSSSSLPQPSLATPSTHTTSASELISENRTIIKDTFVKTRDELRNILTSFEAAQSTIDKKLLEQHRLLEDANGHTQRAESDLRTVQELAKSLKRQNNAIEDRNAELSEKNKKFAASMANLQTEREEVERQHNEEVKRLHAAKEAAESLEDGATKERKKALEERDAAIAEAEKWKESVTEAEGVIEQAVADKTAAWTEREVIRQETESLRTEVEALKLQLDTLRAQQLGLAGASSYGQNLS